MSIETETTTVSGFDVCDSTAVKATCKRHIGSLPLAVALGCADIGEAKLQDGRRVLITWNRNLNKSEQFWFAHNTSFVPVWVGSADGSCELIIGDSFGSSASEDWLWLGIRIVKEDGTDWTIINDSAIQNQLTPPDPIWNKSPKS